MALRVNSVKGNDEILVLIHIACDAARTLKQCHPRSQCTHTLTYDTHTVTYDTPTLIYDTHTLTYVRIH